MAEREWVVKQLPNGSMGATCPCEDCEGKVVVNPNHVKSSRTALGVKYMICVYCERMSPLPKEVL